MILHYPKLPHDLGDDPEELEVDLYSNDHIVDIADDTESPSPNKTEEMISYLTDCANNEKGLDIYQVSAFDVDGRAFGRTLLAVFAQAIGTYYLLKREIQSKSAQVAETIEALWQGEEDIWFPSTSEDMGTADALLRGAMLTIIVVYSIQQWFKVEGYRRKEGNGMYRINAVNLEDKPHFLSSWKITVGRYINILVLFAMTAGAMFVVVGDPDAFALKFSSFIGVLKMNKLFVQSKDYSDLKAKLVGIKGTKHMVSKGRKFCLWLLRHVLGSGFFLQVGLLYAWFMWMLLRMFSVWLLVSWLISLLLWTFWLKWKLQKVSNQKADVESDHSKSVSNGKHRFLCAVSAMFFCCFVVCSHLIVKYQ